MDAVAPVSDLQAAHCSEAVLPGHLGRRPRIRALRREHGGPGVDPVAQLAQSGHEGLFLVRIKGAFEQLRELSTVDLQRLAHACVAGFGQGRE